jgi:hypothetical protein
MFTLIWPPAASATSLGWRQLLTIGESIGYDRANARGAAYFDDLIDSLCFRPRGSA